MDILSDLLREAGLRRRVLDVHEVRDTDVLRFPCERSVGFHVVLEGTLYVHTDGEAAPLMLDAGEETAAPRPGQILTSTADKQFGRDNLGGF